MTISRNTMALTAAIVPISTDSLSPNKIQKGKKISAVRKQKQGIYTSAVQCSKPEKCVRDLAMQGGT